MENRPTSSSWTEFVAASITAVVIGAMLAAFIFLVPSYKLYQADTSNCQRAYEVNINGRKAYFCRIVDQQVGTDCIERFWEERSDGPDNTYKHEHRLVYFGDNLIEVSYAPECVKR